MFVLLILLSEVALCQRSYFIVPYLGFTNGFCKEFASMPGYRVNNFNLSGSYGVSFEIQRKNKKSYRLINIETDAIGYGVIEERQSVGASSFFQKGLVKRRMTIMNPIIRGAFLYKLPLLKELVYKDSKIFLQSPI